MTTVVLPAYLGVLNSTERVCVVVAVVVWYGTIILIGKSVPIVFFLCYGIRYFEQTVGTIRKESEVLTSAESTINEQSNRLENAEKKVADNKYRLKTTK